MIYDAYLSYDDNVDYGMSYRSVRGSLVSLMKLEPVSESQCKMTITSKIDGGGWLPDFVVDSKIADSLTLAEVRENFNRDEEIDQLERTALCALMNHAGEACITRDLPMLEGGVEAYKPSELGGIESQSLLFSLQPPTS